MIIMTIRAIMMIVVMTAVMITFEMTILLITAEEPIQITAKKSMTPIVVNTVVKLPTTTSVAMLRFMTLLTVIKCWP